MDTTSPYLLLRIVERESAPAGEVGADRVIVHHHRERAVHSDVRVHQAPELLRVIVPFIPRNDESSEKRWGGHQENGRGRAFTVKQTIILSTHP